MIDERRFRLPCWDPGAGNDRSAVYAAVRIRLIICHPHGLTLGAHRHSQKNRLTVSVRSDHIWDAGPFADVAMLLQQFALAICCWSRLSFTIAGGITMGWRMLRSAMCTTGDERNWRGRGRSKKGKHSTSGFGTISA